MSAQALQVSPATRQWLETQPGMIGELDADADALARFVHAGEALLEALPPKTARIAPQQTDADAILRACRTVRAKLMRLHAEAVYAQLSDLRSMRLTLAELVYGAAARFPGLVPTRAQIEAERGCLQSEKLGREIDQGIFLAAVLAAPLAGRHLVESLLLPSARAQSLLAGFQRDGEIRLARLHLARRGTIAHLTVHNEACLNAEDDQLIEDMETAVDLVLLDPACRVGVLRGAVMNHPKYAGRRVFSAGINLKHLHRGQISYVEFLMQREMGYISKLLRGLLLEQPLDGWGSRKHEKPWVAAVDSFAIGGGAQLLLAFDRVIAEAGSFFSLPAAQEGIVPGVANLRLSKSLGLRKARQVILDGRRIYAHEPDAGMLIDLVVEPAQMDAAIERAAQRLDNDAVVANRRMLVSADEPLESFREYMAEFALEQACRLYSPDVLEKVARA
jgi:thioesterase DpgC